MKHAVTVQIGSGRGVDQPETFRCCPLGVQFDSEKEIPAGEMMEFELRPPSRNGSGPPPPLVCSGVVVHCRPERSGGRFRVWLLFLDPPDEVRERMACFVKAGDTLCPHCENF